MKKSLISIVIVFLFLNLSAEKYSVKKAVLFSAILPGMGQIYTQNYGKAGAFLVTDISVWLGFTRLQYEKDLAIDKYEIYAETVGGVENIPSNAYYQTIQRYQSSEEYNNNVERYARDMYLIFGNDPVGYEKYLADYRIPSEYAWDWQNVRNLNNYRVLRSNKQDLEIYANFAVAAAIINRVISVIDVAKSTRKLNLEIAEKELGQLKIQPDWAKLGMRVNYEIKF